MTHFALKDPLWLLALLALPLIAWLRGRRRVPVLLVPFAAAWHRPSLATPTRWPVALAFAITGAVTFSYGFLETAGFPKLSMFSVWIVMGASWSLTILVRGMIARRTVES